MNPFRCIAASFLLLLVGAAEPGLEGGQWEVRNTPGVATLDGRSLSELPIGPIKTETMCLAGLDSAGLARFLVGDLGEDCTIATSSVRGGKVRIAGSCPNQLEGPDSSFELTGRYDGDSYSVNFATAAVGDNGRMTFSGTMTGRKTGACPSK